MKYENVVWDWNGTLLDDVRVSVGAINRMLERRGIPGLTVERYRDIFGFPVRDYYESIGFDFARDDWDGVSREFVQDYDALATDVQLTEGVRPVLERLKEEGKRFYFPRYVAERKEYELVGVDDPASGLVRAKFGLLEPRPELPAAPAGIVARMLFLTPAVACDRRGVRLGRGGGFYDRMLAGESGAVVAVVYGCQLTENLPREPHDRSVDFAVTEEEILEFS